MLLWISVWSLFHVLVLKKYFFLRKAGLQFVCVCVCVLTTTASLCSSGWPQTSYLGLPSAGIMGTGRHARLGCSFHCLEPGLFRLCAYLFQQWRDSSHILCSSWLIGQKVLLACLSGSESTVMAENVSCTSFPVTTALAFDCPLWVCMWVSLRNRHIHVFLVLSEMKTSFMWKCSALMRTVFVHLMWPTEYNLTW